MMLQAGNLGVVSKRQALFGLLLDSHETFDYRLISRIYGNLLYTQAYQGFPLDRLKRHLWLSIDRVGQPNTKHRQTDVMRRTRTLDTHSPCGRPAKHFIINVQHFTTKLKMLSYGLHVGPTCVCPDLNILFLFDKYGYY